MCRWTRGYKFRIRGAQEGLAAIPIDTESDNAMRVMASHW
ncbi:hypothetical protein N806_32205 [Rhodococcus sp. P27]|nr:hypothetical protein N601_10615 [Rhodococcus erythropolis DN1]ERB55779.1 hypothetical protein N806_32205 [Rhodococcus sp. P27]